MERLNNIITEDCERIGRRIAPEAARLAGKTLLVTGGSGFLGGYFLDVVSWLNEHQLSTPCRLICLDNLLSGKKDRIAHLLDKNYFTFLEQDVTKPLSFQGPLDYIIHAASCASPTIYRQYPIETIDANVLGARSLLQQAYEKNAQSFLYLSSSEIYGDPLAEHIPTPETYRGNVSCTGPRACYDESKRLAETLCMNFFTKHGVPIKIARPFNLYGPGMLLEDKRVIPDFVGNVLRKEPLVMYSSGSDLRTFSYVGDAITGFFKILLSDYNGEAFNVGSDLQTETSIKALAHLINELGGNTSEIIHKVSEDKNYLKDNPRRRCPDLTKIKTRLQYEPAIDLKTGLARYMTWCKTAYNL